MKKAFLLFIISQFGIAQPGIIWQKTMGGNQIDGFSSCVVGNDYGFLVGGTSNTGINGDKNEVSRGSTDSWVIKFSEDGLVQWQKTIGGSGSDALNQLINDDENGYFLACTSSSNISGEKTENRRGLSDYWLIKIDNLGNIINQKTIGGDRNDVLTSIIKTNDGLLLSGFSESIASGEKTEDRRGAVGDNDFWIVKMDFNYSIIWQRTIGGNQNDRLYNVIATSDGGFLLAGDSKSSISAEKTETNFGDYDIWIVKVNSQGIIEWQKTLGGSQTEVFGDILQTDDGGFLVGCYSNSSISGNKTENTKGLNDYWVIKLSESGTIEWQKVIGGNDQDNLTSLTKNAQGYVLGGSSKSNFSGDKNSFSRGLEDFWVVMIDFDGNIIGQKTIGGELYDGIENMLVDDNGSIFLGGNSLSSIVGEKTEVNRGGSDYWVMLLESNVLSLESTLFSEIKVFPNPTNKIFDFRFTTPFTGKIVQTDSLGKVIQTLEIKNQVKFSTEVLGSDGIYFFTIENENGLSKTVKIVKQE